MSMMKSTLFKNDNYEFFMQANVNNYIGEWVAVCEGKIVAHGKNAKDVANEARKLCGNKKILLARVPDKETMLF